MDEQPSDRNRTVVSSLDGGLSGPASTAAAGGPFPSAPVNLTCVLLVVPYNNNNNSIK